MARSVVAFTDKFRPTPAFDISKYRQDGSYRSTTGQLRWQEGTSKLDGFFTIDSEATKGVIGFARGVSCQLGQVTIVPRNRFSAVYVTAKDQNETIASASSLLVVAVARARNTGMKVLGDSRLVNRGTSPVVMEPVKARVSIQKSGSPTVHVLDHDGCRTGRTVASRQGTFTIDGARDKTCYYLITYGNR